MQGPSVRPGENFSVGLKERRQREKAQRRREILNAARTLLFEKGLPATSINRIAESAELGVGTIYSYYKSKEEIFVALQEEGLSLLYDSLSRIHATAAGPVEKLQGYAAAYLDFSRDSKDYFDIINYFLSSAQVMLPVPLKNRIDRHGSNILRIVAASIQAGVGQNIFREVEAKRYAMILWGTVHGIILLRKMQGTILKTEHYDSLYQAAVENFISGLVR